MLIAAGGKTYKDLLFFFSSLEQTLSPDFGQMKSCLSSNRKNVEFQTIDEMQMLKLDPPAFFNGVSPLQVVWRQCVIATENLSVLGFVLHQPHLLSP